MNTRLMIDFVYIVFIMTKKLMSGVMVNMEEYNRKLISYNENALFLKFKILWNGCKKYDQDNAASLMGNVTVVHLIRF